jgi:hypothetical protein
MNSIHLPRRADRGRAGYSVILWPPLIVEEPLRPLRSARGATSVHRSILQLRSRAGDDHGPTTIRTQDKALYHPRWPISLGSAGKR